MNWEQIPRDEQECIINVDYYEKKLTLYTSRKSVAERLKRKIGEPTKVDKRNGLISGVTYERSIFDKDVSKFFSKLLIIGAFRENDIQNEELYKEGNNDIVE